MWRLVAVVVALAGCGDGIGAPEATPPPDSNQGLVRVHFSGVVIAGTRVFFQNADSSLVLATRLDSQGDANGYIAAGGFVSVVMPGDTQRVYTAVGVEPGDVIQVQFGTGAEALSSSPIVIKVPVAPDQSIYSLNSSCGFRDIRGAEVAPIQLFLDGCGDSADMLVTAIGNQYRYLYRADVPVGANKSVVFDEPYRPLDRARVVIENAPPTVAEIIVAQSLISDRRELWGERTTGLGTSVVQLDGGGGALDHDMVLPPSGVMLTRTDPSFTAAVGSQHIAQWGPPVATTTVDFAASALREYSSRPAYVRGEHALRWTEGTTGDVPDGVLATFNWNVPATTKNVVWTILAPRGEEPVIRFPVLPDASLIPTSTDIVNAPFVLSSMKLDGGYRRIRQQHLLGSFGEPGVPWPPDGPTGRVVYQDLSPQLDR